MHTRADMFTIGLDNYTPHNLNTNVLTLRVHIQVASFAALAHVQLSCVSECARLDVLFVVMCVGV